MIVMIFASWSPNSSKATFKGVFSSVVLEMDLWIVPIAVFSPVRKLVIINIGFNFSVPSLNTINTPYKKDLTNLNSNSNGLPNGNRGTGKQNINLILQNALFILDNDIHFFTNTDTFTGKNGLIYTETTTENFNDTKVSRDFISDG